MTLTNTSAVGYDKIDFESSGGKIENFNDGHIPETFSHQSNDVQEPSRLVRYPLHVDQATQVRVHDGVLPPQLAHALYEATAQKESPWGTYVTLEQAREYWKQSPGGLTRNWNESLYCSTNDGTRSLDQHRHDLAVHATAYFLTQMLMSCPNDVTWKSSNGSSSSELRSSWQELETNKAHGVAVWALASEVSSQVQYHLDYAELIRYEHNVICPPLYAGTVQCTPAKLEGGDFCVQLNGLSHYQQHGYKGNNSGDPWAGWTQPQKNDGGIHYNDETSWITIPYRFNRGICHIGHLPHLSTPVKSIDSVEPAANKRVILGFNVFCNDIGPLVQQAPEHSNAFRRRIQLHRSILSKKSQSLSVDRIRQSKGLTKLLVLAKREAVKQEFIESRRQLDKDIDAMLMESNQEGLFVSELMSKLQKTNGSWPNAVDVQVHLSHRLAKSCEISNGAHDVIIKCKHVGPSSENIKGILPEDKKIYLEKSC